MKERPILFSGQMVRAILAGRKTRTRRVMKPKACDNLFPKEWKYDYALPENRERLLDLSPYGRPSDRLWVRETIKPVEETAANGTSRGVWAYYAADDTCCPGNHPAWRVIPSLFMPRTLSRITLEITDVRAERLQDITNEDALAEGCEYQPVTVEDIAALPEGSFERQFAEVLGPGQLAPRYAFIELWDQINGKKHPWTSNPFVWVIAFKRVEAN